MFMDLVEYPIENERLLWEARQVLQDLHGIPHLLLRIRLTGTYFQQRALEPFVLIGGVRSRFVQIAEDGRSASAFFDRLPRDGNVEFGYGKDLYLRFPGSFTSRSVRMLDPKRLPSNTLLMLARDE